MSYDELFATIQERGRRYINTREDWEAEIVEWETISDIFGYALAKGFNPPDYNLKAILEAEDDESPGVPEIGCQEALIDLMERITQPEQPHGVDEPQLRNLFLELERAFWR